MSSSILEKMTKKPIENEAIQNKNKANVSMPNSKILDGGIKKTKTIGIEIKNAIINEMVYGASYKYLLNTDHPFRLSYSKAAATDKIAKLLHPLSHPPFKRIQHTISRGVIIHAIAQDAGIGITTVGIGKHSFGMRSQIILHHKTQHAKKQGHNQNDKQQANQHLPYSILNPLWVIRKKG